jgi:hypothetical protein
MRDYGRVYCSFWTSEDIRSLSEDARTLALYLLTSPHGTIAGVCRLPDGYVCEDLKWVPERVSEGFRELSHKGFGKRCETTKWVWICKFFEWNLPENPNQWKAARRVSLQVPDNCSWKACFLDVFARAAGDDPAPAKDPSGTLTKPFRNQDQDQDQDQEVRDVELNSTSAGEKNGKHGAPPGDVERVFDHWRDTWKKHKAKLDNKRLKAIKLALKSYPAEDLCRAISGYRNSPHHLGQNERKTPYDDVELFLRDSKHVEAGMQLAEKHGSGGIQWQ